MHSSPSSSGTSCCCGGSPPPARTRGSTSTVQSLAPPGDSVAVSYASDAGHLRRLGVECVLLGPGCMERAHKANEWIARDELAAGRELLDALVGRLCG